MAKLAWAISCHRIIVDSETNSVSYIDSLEQIGATALPVTVAFGLGLVWFRELAGEAIMLRVTVINSSGGVVSRVEGQLLHPTAMYHRANLTVEATFRVLGVHDVVVEQKAGEGWIEEARIPLTIAMLPARADVSDGDTSPIPGT